MSESYGAVVRRLGQAQKSNKGAPAYSRFVNRPLGRRFAAVAYLAKLRPNQVTALSAVCTFSGIAVMFFVPQTVLVGVVISVLLVVGYALDAADGQLARLTGGGSSAGEWLDHMVDSFKVCLLHLTILAVWSRAEDRLWLLVPFCFAVVANVSFFAQLLNEQLRRAHYRTAQKRAPVESSGMMRSLAAIPTDYGFLCLIFVLWGFGVGFKVAYTVAALGSAGYLLLALFKWHGDMRRLDRGASA